jgi:YHS domain-containing protein
MLRKLSAVSLGLVALGLIVLAGCNTATPPNPGPAATDKAADAKDAGKKDKGSEDHAHKPGTHGGTIVEIGRDNYHAEAVFEKNGVVRVYTLGKDEARIEEVESQTMTAYARAEGATEAIEFTFAPVPRKDDSKGKTSQFVGTLPKELWGKRVEVTVPSIRIADARYRFGFTNVTEAGHGEAMPSKVADEEERKLYLTPGGLYTEADIKANGGVTASQKFRGQMPIHDAHPKKGDQICPISETKANAKFTWVVGGKTYEFCCPPCVDEFVKKAKEHPQEIKAPGEYRAD